MKPLLVMGLWPALAMAQSAADLKQILERLDRLEQQNRELQQEVRDLRSQLGKSEETLAVEERRTAEMAQTKVEAANRFPIRVTGMALFNTYWNTSAGTSDYPTSVPLSGRERGGATIRQSIVGLDFQGPRTFWDGKVRGSLNMDFYAGTGTSLNQLFRVRTGSIEVDWKTRSFMVGQEKPIIAPRDPSSIAMVGVSPLTGAGNLWLWQPQARVEQRFNFTESTTLRAQLGVYQTSESSAQTPAAYQPSLAGERPALQGRFELAHALGESRRIEVAPGFHTSSTHVAFTSVPSNAFSLDWFANPWSRLEFSGAFFSGQNLANLGTGLRQGFTIRGPGDVIPVHSRGGWAQLAFIATPRLTFHFFGGQQDDRDADLLIGGIAKNQAYGGNFFFRLAPNVIASFEATQYRTTYIGSGNRLNRHYDLALAYLF